MAGVGARAPPRLVEPQQEVFAVPPISAGGDLDDIHPMRRGGVKSFVDDLVLGRGVVIGRAATSLRSVETQPWTRRFVRTRRATYLRLRQGVLVRWLWLAGWLAGRGRRPFGHAGSNPAPGFCIL